MTSAASPRPEISIVVSNWNGIEFIEPCVTTLWRSGEALGRPFELILVDDVSSDGSPERAREVCPGLRLIRNEANMGFARTCNRGARAGKGRVLVMMNNDMKVSPDFIRILTSPFFEKPDAPESGTLFCVGAKTIDWHDGRPNHLCMDAVWRRGAIGTDYSDPDLPVKTAFAQGGSAAFDRGLFLDLGGFAPVFHPAYWEDYDLCYRACKRSWRVLYEPRAVAHHKGKASQTRANRLDRLERVVERNRLWTTWLNLSDPVLWIRHLAALPWVYARDIVTGRGFNPLLGFFEALGGVGRVLCERRSRRKEDGPPRRSDLDILGLDSAFDRSGGRVAGRSA